MRILMFVSRFPYPLEKGDKLRAYNQIKYLSKDHKITLIALSDKHIKPEWKAALEPYCEKIHLFRIKKISLVFAFLKALLSNYPFQAHYFYRYTIQKKINKIITNGSYDLIYCQLLRMALYVRKFQHPKVIDYMDALSKGVDKRIKHEAFYKRWLYKEEHRRLVRFENLTFDYFDAHTIISELDKQSIYHERQKEIKVIPNGLDQSFFEYKTNQKPEYDLVFTGNMSYPPNVHAAQFLAEKIIPSSKTNLSLILAGAEPNHSVKKLQNSNTTVSGWIDDIRSAYTKGKIFIAPMNIGTGVQNKILEAMALGMPCIISEYTAKSLQGENDVHYKVCNTVASYAEAINFHLNNPKEAENMGKNAKKWVKKKYNWEKSNKKLSELFDSLV